MPASKPILLPLEVTADAEQKPILRPDLWNVLYDGLLRLDMQNYVFTVGYADDVTAVITASTPELAHIHLNMIRANTWIAYHILKMVVSKTKIVMNRGLRY